MLRKDDEAARQMYRKYHMEPFSRCRHVLGDQGQAEERVQQTFIKLRRRAKNYPSPACTRGSRQLKKAMD